MRALAVVTPHVSVAVRLAGEQIAADLAIEASVLDELAWKLHKSRYGRIVRVVRPNVLLAILVG